MSKYELFIVDASDAEAARDAQRRADPIPHVRSLGILCDADDQAAARKVGESYWANAFGERRPSIMRITLFAAPAA